MTSLTPSSAARLILAVRFLLGTLSLVFPRLSSRLMLLDPDRNPSSSYLVRLFGGRDIFLGVAALVVPREHRNRILGYAAPIDLADATAAATAGLRGQISPQAAVLAAASGLLGACLGAAAAGRGPLAAKMTTPGGSPDIASRRPTAIPRDATTDRASIVVDGTFVMWCSVTAE